MVKQARPSVYSHVIPTLPHLIDFELFELPTATIHTVILFTSNMILRHGLTVGGYDQDRVTTVTSGISVKSVRGSEAVDR